MEDQSQPQANAQSNPRMDNTEEQYNMNPEWDVIHRELLNIMEGKPGLSFCERYTIIYELCVFHQREAELFRRLLDFLTIFVKENIIDKLNGSGDPVGALVEKCDIFRSGVEKISAFMLFLEEQYLSKLGQPTTIKKEAFHLLADGIFEEKSISEMLVNAFVNDMKLIRKGSGNCEDALTRLSKLYSLVKQFGASAFSDQLKAGMEEGCKEYAMEKRKIAEEAGFEVEEYLLDCGETLENEAKSLNSIGFSSEVGINLIKYLISVLGEQLFPCPDWWKVKKGESLPETVSCADIVGSSDWYVHLFTADEEDSLEIATSSMRMVHHILSISSIYSLVNSFTRTVLSSTYESHMPVLIQEESAWVPLRSVLIPSLMNDRMKLLRFVEEGLAHEEPEGKTSLFPFTDGLDVGILERTLNQNNSDEGMSEESEGKPNIPSHISSFHRREKLTASVLDAFSSWTLSLEVIPIELADYLHYLLSGPLQSLVERINSSLGSEESAEKYMEDNGAADSDNMGILEATNYLGLVLSSFTSCINKSFAERYTNLTAVRLSMANAAPCSNELEMYVTNFLSKCDDFNVQEASLRMLTVMEDLRLSTSLAVAFNRGLERGTISLPGFAKGKKSALPYFAPSIIRRNLWSEEMGSGLVPFDSDDSKLVIHDQFEELTSIYSKWYVRESPGSTSVDFSHIVRILPLDGWGRIKWFGATDNPAGYVWIILPMSCLQALMAMVRLSSKFDSEIGVPVAELLKEIPIGAVELERILVSLLRGHLIRRPPGGPRLNQEGATVVFCKEPLGPHESLIRVHLASPSEVDEIPQSPVQPRLVLHRHTVTICIMNQLKEHRHMQTTALFEAVCRDCKELKGVEPSEESFKKEVEDLIAKNMISRDGTKGVQWDN